MATQNCPGILQVEMRYKLDGQNIFNVFHVDNKTLGLWELADIEQILEVFYTDYWVGAQKALLPAAVTLNEIVGTDLTSLYGKKVVRPVSPAEAGSAAGDSLPANATLAVKLSPALRGRGRAGRVFWPALPESVVASNTVSTSYASDVVLALLALKDAIDAVFGVFILSILSRRNGGAPRPTGVGEDVVSVSVTDLTVDSQRDRLPGHKRHKRRRL